MRRDVADWLKSIPPSVKQVANKAVGWGGVSALRARVFDLGPSLMVVFYSEPKLDDYGQIPDRVLGHLQDLLEPYREDPRPWVVHYWDQQLSFIERPVGGGMYEKVYFGSMDSVLDLKERLAPGSVGEVSVQDFSGVAKITLDWLGLRRPAK